jgi:hypothetical protein
LCQRNVEERMRVAAQCFNAACFGDLMTQQLDGIFECHIIPMLEQLRRVVVQMYTGNAENNRCHESKEKR